MSSSARGVCSTHVLPLAESMGFHCAIAAALAAVAVAAAAEVHDAQVPLHRRASWRRDAEVESSDAPAMLAVIPDQGPIDGGTKVRVRTQNLNMSATYFAEIQSVKKGTQSSKVQTELHFAGEDAYFVMPDLTFKKWGTGSAILVSLREHVKKVAKKGEQIGPLLFRLHQPLSSLRPTEVTPCCKFKTSGGELIALTIKKTGIGESVPGQRATFRFKGLDKSKDMPGQYLRSKEHAEWVAAGTVRPKSHEEEPRSENRSWHFYGVTPAWPFAEEDIHVEISWNKQQFVGCSTVISFKDPHSFFGTIATQLDEEHAGNPGLDDGEASNDVLTAVYSNSKGRDKDGEKHEMTDVTLRDARGDAFILSRPIDTTHLEEDWRIIQDIFFLTIACAAGGSLAEKMSVPNIIGYLIGGMFIGPGGFDVIMELVQIESIAQIGVCLLLFCIGLELTCDELVTNSRSALAGLLAMVLLCCCTVCLALFLTETEVREAVLIGLFASLASTPVSLQAIAPSGTEQSKSQKAEKSVLLAVLIAQDIMLAALLAGMPLLFRPSGDKLKTPGQESAHHSPTPPPVAGEPISVIAAAACAVFVTVVLASWYLRRLGLSGAVARDWLLALTPGLLLLTMLSYAFAMAHFTNDLNLSLELGAFMAGLMMKMKSPAVAEKTEHLIAMVKDVFVAWFFASIGLVIPPLFLFDNLRIILSVGIVFFLLKLITGFIPLFLLSVRMSGAPLMQALRTSWILAHISEFGFVLASKGEKWGLISRHVYLLLLGTNAMSLCLAPFLFRARDFLLPVDDFDEDTREAKSPSSTGGKPRKPAPHCFGYRDKERASPHDSDLEAEDLQPLRSRTDT